MRRSVTIVSHAKRAFRKENYGQRQITFLYVSRVYMVYNINGRCVCWDSIILLYERSIVWQKRLGMN
jgi:hypothetical protein